MSYSKVTKPNLTKCTEMTADYSAEIQIVIFQSSNPFWNNDVTNADRRQIAGE